MEVKNKTVFVGLSGGVDSAVSAALLKEQGAHVTGVFIKGWYPPGMPCSWAEERRDAMRVAAHLHIPFRTLDASTEYKKSVIDYLLSEYRTGRTPNPDVMCNREVKFGAFYRYAIQEGADYIATGHYRSGEKDQSYFLWAVPKEILARTIFPVGMMEKTAVRKLAQKYGLPVSNKKDSQGICFLGSVSVDEFLRIEFGVHTGRVLDTSGKEVGTHDGVLLYTLGERVSLSGGPWYVLAKDIFKNELIAGNTRTLIAAPSSGVPFHAPNWWGAAEAVTNAQYRYRGQRIAGRISDNHFIPSEPLSEPIADGQSLVFYHGGECIGGATIGL